MTRQVHFTLTITGDEQQKIDFLNTLTPLVAVENFILDGNEYKKTIHFADDIRYQENLFYYILETVKTSYPSLLINAQYEYHGVTF